MDLINEIEFNKFCRVVLNTYYSLNPNFCGNDESTFQLLLQENIRLVYGIRADSEYSVNRHVKNILGENIAMNNRTTRFDLMIRPDPYNIIMELKAVDKLKEEHIQQLINYMETVTYDGNSPFKTGVLINFGRNIKNLCVHIMVFSKTEEYVEGVDRFGMKYKHHRYKKINEFISEKYDEVMGSCIIDENENENVINIE